VTGEPGSEHRRKAGRALRKQVPRAGHGSWSPAPGRPDPIGMLEENNRSRLPDLVPVRYWRMLASVTAGCEALAGAARAGRVPVVQEA
jgi:hypothetical protein